MLDKKQKTWLIVAIVVVVLILIIALSGKKAPQPTEEYGLPSEVDLENMPAAPEVKVSEPEAIAPGASEVTSEGVVLNEQGTPAVTENIIPNSPEAPKQSDFLTEEQKEEIVDNSIQIRTSRDGGFNPSSFKVKPGQAVTIVLTGEDQDNHALFFKDPILSAVAIGLIAGQSRAITFNAPSTPGVYEFVCSYAGHEKETGQMVVTEE